MKSDSDYWVNYLCLKKKQMKNYTYKKKKNPEFEYIHKMRSQYILKSEKWVR